YWVTFRQGNEWFSLWDWKKSGIDVEHERTVATMKVKRNLILDPRMPVAEKKRSIRYMARDQVGMQMLLGILAERQVPPSLFPFVKEMIGLYGDEKVRLQAASYFANADGASYSVDRIVALRGDAGAGEATFATQCLTCHRAGGKGATIGPDL